MHNVANIVYVNIEWMYEKNMVDNNIRQYKNVIFASDFGDTFRQNM